MRKFSNFILIFVLVSFSEVLASAQDLEVKKSPDKNKVSLRTSNGVSTVIFESNLKNLSISCENNDEFIQESDKICLFRILPYKDSVDVVLNMPVYPKRQYILKTPQTSEYLLKIDEILPNQVLHYTVVLARRYPLNFSLEYEFSKAAIYGVRVSAGKQFGGYVSWRWGRFRPSGANIETITTDYDVSDAAFKGYIRTSITTGFRCGLFCSNLGEKRLALYLLAGGGYGEYGRQWENTTQVEGSRFFHSDYFRGFDGDIAIQFNYRHATVSAGTNFLISNGKTSVDFLLGIGFNLSAKKREQ